MTGLELVTAMLHGELPAPPVGALLGLRGVEVAEGRAVLAFTPAPEHGNGGGVVHGGILATALDSAMFYAVLTTLPAQTGATTLDITVRFLRPIPLDAGEALVEGRSAHAGRRAGMATGTIRDSKARECVFASTGCLVIAP